MSIPSRLRHLLPRHPANRHTRCSRRRDVSNFLSETLLCETLLCETSTLTLPRPLSPSELQVLRAQYEKEGDMVGVQTKFNYAWVRLSSVPQQFIVFIANRTRALSNQTTATTSNSASVFSATYSASLPNVAANVSTTSPWGTTNSATTARHAVTTTSFLTRSLRTFRRRTCDS